jgi:NAD(P)-dependent dehydrogenase (short-subunit alcohol dehydrogenase family)
MTGESMANASTPVAVVTGASRGLGAEIAVALAEDGFDIALVARSTEHSPGKLSGTIDEVGERVVALGRRALPIAADVRDESSIAAVVDKVYEHFGRCDVLVNNAGILTPQPLMETPTKLWRLVMDVNLTAPFVFTRELFPRMVEAKSGRVVNISSGAAAFPDYPYVSYCAAKRGLEALTEGLGRQTGPYIAVNALQIDAVIWSEGLAALQGPEAAAAAEQPGRVARAVVQIARQPLDVSGRVFLLSEIDTTGSVGVAR